MSFNLVCHVFSWLSEIMHFCYEHHKNDVYSCKGFSKVYVVQLEFIGFSIIQLLSLIVLVSGGNTLSLWKFVSPKLSPDHFSTCFWILSSQWLLSSFPNDEFLLALLPISGILLGGGNCFCSSSYFLCHYLLMSLDSWAFILSYDLKSSTIIVCYLNCSSFGHRELLYAARYLLVIRSHLSLSISFNLGHQELFQDHFIFSLPHS
jgi:hypothetical protein